MHQILPIEIHTAKPLKSLTSPHEHANGNLNFKYNIQMNKAKISKVEAINT